MAILILIFKSNKMKKILLSISLIIISTIFIISCTNNESINEPKNEEFEKFKTLGKKHNEALDYFINKVKKTRKSELQKVISINGISETVNEFAKQDDVLKNCSEFVHNSCEKTCKKMFGNNIKLAKNTNSKTSEIDIFTNPNANEYVNTIKNLDNYTDYLTYQKKLDQLMSKLGGDNTISENEKYTIYTIASIGYSSSEYWETKGENWFLNKTKHSYNKVDPKEFWKDFLKADIAGAIGGAQVGAGTAGIVVPVIGAIPGAVVGAASGGLGASIVWGTAELVVDSLFD
jgi:hypothetical protein